MIGLLNLVPAFLRRIDLERLLPWIGGAALAALVWWQIRSAIAAAEQRGAAAQRVEAARQGDALRADREAAVAAVDRSAAAAIQSRQSQEVRYVERIRTLYRDRPDPVCIDADGMRVVADADGAAAGPPADDRPAAVRKTPAS